MDRVFDLNEQFPVSLKDKKDPKNIGWLCTYTPEEMIKDLTREYHRARQQQITMEITEIVSGAEALIGS